MSIKTSVPAVSATSRAKSTNRSTSTTAPLFVDARSLPKDYWDAVSQLAIQRIKNLELESKLEAKTAEVVDLKDKIAITVELLSDGDFDELCGCHLIQTFDLEGKTEYLMSQIPAKKRQRIFGSNGLGEHLRKLNYAYQLSSDEELKAQYKELVEMGIITEGYPMAETINTVMDILQDRFEE
jgi:hypothetical protein